MAWIDSHTHLESFHRRGELQPVLARAAEAGVTRMITIGTDSEDWTLYRDLSARHPQTIAHTVGIHPCHVGEKWREEFDQIAGFFEGEGRPIALGETGLDRFHLSKEPEQAETEFARQREAFGAQLELAARLAVPVVVHSRGAFAECLGMVDESAVDWEKVVFHCFAEDADAMERLRERGGRGSFTGILTYKSAEAVRAAALAQGIDRLMLETDAPYLAPVPKRGKPNEPAYLAHTARFAAELFGVTPEDLARRTTETTKAFFGLA